jgi:L-lactate utilization protein LutC
MRVGLFIPCYMDAFEPEVGIATLELLERLGYAVFHTGPSATGDIESVLIHGAQGVRSLTVILKD